MCTLSSTGREIEICFTGFRSPNLSVSSIYFCFTCSALFAGIWSHLFKTNDVHWVNNFSFIFLYFCRLLASLDKIKRSCFRIMKRKSKWFFTFAELPKAKMHINARDITTYFATVSPRIAGRVGDNSPRAFLTRSCRTQRFNTGQLNSWLWTTFKLQTFPPLCVVSKWN